MSDLCEAGPWGLVVADEAQHAKNPGSVTAKAMRALPAQARVALSGTPVENNLTELWALLDWATTGVALVPGPGLIDYERTCPGWGFPCKHAAAVSYQYARAVDARPDALLLLRGHPFDFVCEEAALRCAEREAAAAEQAAVEAVLPILPGT